MPHVCAHKHLFSKSRLIPVSVSEFAANPVPNVHEFAAGTLCTGKMSIEVAVVFSYRMEEPEELNAFQSREWDPVLNWVKDR